MSELITVWGRENPISYYRQTEHQVQNLREKKHSTFRKQKNTPAVFQYSLGEEHMTGVVRKELIGR